jgi:hypothetical protein
MAADRPAKASRVPPSSPSAPENPSISPSSHSMALNGINAETLRYVVSLGDRSTHKSPRSANTPDYPPLAERQHLPSHPAPRRARLPPPCATQPEVTAAPAGVCDPDLVFCRGSRVARGNTYGELRQLRIRGLDRGRYGWSAEPTPSSGQLPRPTGRAAPASARRDHRRAVRRRSRNATRRGP